MPLPNILRKASNYILGECGQDNRNVIYQDGETLFCKNNVCVHPPTLIRQHTDVVHHPGYMTITCKLNKNSNLPTLHLSWIPNSTLRKHPTTLESLSAKNTVIHRDVDPISQIHDKTCDTLNFLDLRHENGNENDNDNGNGKLDVCLEAKEPVTCGDCERVCSGSSHGYDDFLNRRARTVVNDSENSETEDRSNVESIEPKNDGTEEFKERGKDSDTKSTDEEPRFSYCDDISIKSRSLSLTSTCSLSIAITNDGMCLYIFFTLFH